MYATVPSFAGVSDWTRAWQQIPVGRSDKKLTSVQSTCRIKLVRPINSLTFMPFLSQGLCTNEAENTVIFLCGATTANVY